MGEVERYKLAVIKRIGHGDVMYTMGKYSQ